MKFKQLKKKKKRQIKKRQKKKKKKTSRAASILALLSRSKDCFAPESEHNLNKKHF
jgi:hypothetical protein